MLLSRYVDFLTDYCSIRVNDKYRIEFSLNEFAEKPILTICNIVELSNHYD